MAWRFATTFGAAAILLLALPAAAADLAILRNGFTISHDHRRVVGDKTRLFLSTDDSSFTDVATDEITGFEKDLSLPAQLKPAASLPISSAPVSRTPVSSRSAVDLSQVVNSASAAYHLDPDLVNSVIHAESGFNSHAVSPKGARGLMQLMPSTASALGVSDKDAFDPQANVSGGSRYLRELLERYNFDLVKALAAYNAGPERVEQYNGVPPFHATRAYVARIVHEYNRKKIAQEKAAALTQKEQKKTAKAAHAKAAATPNARTTSSSSTLSRKPAAQLAANSDVGSSSR